MKQKLSCERSRNKVREFRGITVGGECNIPGDEGTWRLLVGTLRKEGDLDVSCIPVWKCHQNWFLKIDVKAEIRGLRDQEMGSSEARLHRWIEQELEAKPEVSEEEKISKRICDKGS